MTTLAASRDANTRWPDVTIMSRLALFIGLAPASLAFLAIV